ncbi:ABC transporter ATP-binding protein [Thiospirochaeta perfilievii]|uniref:Spermidine/putrescine import ATP-binding protein PotA n=1 Tax=Thiospirochaeta perfilievii TaxID=252967 RepID=A0A5C1Q7N7_9SPIO|nr:ABC transporter ATP-binding protein [Thiospirochaeta perfilievii]QEN03451.1 ABC transporter ATP-binding protein [Thiospirochaeta perfilievii]
MAILNLENINKKFEQHQVLKNIKLSINQGEFFTFLGPSGCGKTTLLRIIAGFVNPDVGSVIFENREITSLSAEKREIGMVFQNYALFPFMNVFENVAYGLRIRHEKKCKIETQVKKYLSLVNLEGFEKRDVSELSGGEQQRVALARSLVLEPKLLLLDEPLSNLDARLRDKMRTELKEIQRKLGITTIFVTHDQTEALTMSDRIAVFDKGQCVQVGSPHEIYAEPVNSLVANFIGEMNLIEATIDNSEAIISSTLTLKLPNQQKGCYIAIRPQDILIKDHNDALSNTVEGFIEEINLNGAVIEYIVNVESIKFKVVTLNRLNLNSSYTLGERIFLYISPQSIKTLIR